MSPRHPVHQSWPWRGEVQSSWGGENPTSLPTSGGHWGDLPTIQGLEAKRRTNSAPLGWTSKASSPSIRDSHPIQTLLASTGISSHLTNNSTVQLCRDDSLSMDTTALGNGLWGIPQHPIHGSGGDPQNLHHKYEPHHKRWGNRCHIYGHGHYLHLEGGPDPEASSQGPTIEDVTDWIESQLIIAFGQTTSYSLL